MKLFGQSNIEAFAKSVSLDIPTWDHCMQGGTYKQVMQGNLATMSSIGAVGTPHFVINNTNYSGSPPYALFKTAIDAQLHKS